MQGANQRAAWRANVNQDNDMRDLTQMPGVVGKTVRCAPVARHPDRH
jgi:hypothetical protein